MTNTDRERTTALTRKTKDLMDVWLRERKAMLLERLAANAEIKQRWLDANPLEVSQRQRGYHADAKRCKPVRWENRTPEEARP
jgi:hypothetical protein